MSFIQEPPEWFNQYDHDPLLSHYIRTILPESHRKQVDADLKRLGQRAIGDIMTAGVDAELNEPYLVNYDSWGNRVDQVVVSRGWDKLKTIAAEEGLVAIGYEREFGEFSRIVQFAKLLLYTPSSAMYTCPLAMTDGAARLIETLCPNKLKEQFYHLTSRNPLIFWTSGQWMTERSGGSDLNGSETVARPEGDGYQLFGDKWFTSAITGEMTMTLARVEEDGQLDDRLSLFFLRIRDDDGQLNGMTINKLKDKLGTRALPTAEVTLKGSKAVLLGERGRGIKQISTILNITRIYNSMAALAYMQRGLYLAKAYASKRQAFGARLDQLPLHRKVLAGLEISYLHSFVAVSYIVELMGRVELKVASKAEEQLFRLLTPMVKLFTGKESVAFMSEVVESFGGQGYIEELPVAALFRDAQVLPIWEGTTNVLSLDVLRVISKQGLDYLATVIRDQVSSYKGELNTEPLKVALKELEKYMDQFREQNVTVQQLVSRDLSFSLMRLVIASRLTAWHDRFEALRGKINVSYNQLINNRLLVLTSFESMKDLDKMLD